MCACTGGGCHCHATNVRKMRKVKAALRRQTNARKAHGAKAAKSVSPKEGGVTKPSSGFVTFALKTENSFRKQIQNFDAKNNGLVNRMLDMRSQIPGTFVPGNRALRGEASRETRTFETSTGDDLSPSVSMGDDPERPITSNDVDTSSDELQLELLHTDDVPFFSQAEEAMLLDVLTHNEKLIAQNDLLRDEVFKKSEKLFDDDGMLGNSGETLGGKMDLAMMVDGFVNRPEMGSTALYVHANALLSTRDSATGTNANALTSRKKQKSSLVDSSIDMLESQNLPAPRPVCETSDGGAINSRRAKYSFRLFCFIITFGFIVWGFVKLWIGSKPTLCEQREDENLESNLWSIPVLLDKQLHVSKWNTSCTLKRSFISLAWLGFAIVWHALCLQAWLGFRFVRAYVLMNQLEARHRRAAQKSAQDAKADALRGSKLSLLMANEKGSPQVSGNGAMWPQWGRRRSDGSVEGSENSLTDSARGDEAV